jgi:hypothetical protein
VQISPVNLILSNSVLKGGSSMGQNITERLQTTWKRSIQSIGGFWSATAKWEGADYEKEKLFLDCLGYDLQEITNGETTWQGYLAEMTLTRQGVPYRRSLLDMINRVKVKYTKPGTNLITNPSCESAAWDAFGTPTTRERSTAWATDGSYSCHVVTNAYGEGVTIQSAITIVAGRQYDISIMVNVIQGEWRFEVYRTGEVIDSTDVQRTDLGIHELSLSISEDNDYAGSVGLRLYCMEPTADPAEIYADGVTFNTAPDAADTGWQNDTDSQAEYGVAEEIISQSGMTDAAALAMAQTELTKYGWPNVQTPQTINILSRGDRREGDTLELVFLGYCHTLRNKYLTLMAQDDSSVLIDALVDTQPSFITPGSIQTNTLEFNPVEKTDRKAWDMIRDIVLAGDASGNRWEFGVYADRLAYYNQASAVVEMYLRNGELLDGSGGRLEPWRAQPGLIQIDDFTLFSGPTSSKLYDDPRKSYMEVVNFDLGAWLNGDSGLSFGREGSS